MAPGFVNCAAVPVPFKVAITPTVPATVVMMVPVLTVSVATVLVAVVEVLTVLVARH